MLIKSPLNLWLVDLVTFSQPSGSWGIWVACCHGKFLIISPAMAEPNLEHFILNSFAVNLKQMSIGQMYSGELPCNCDNEEGWEDCSLCPWGFHQVLTWFWQDSHLESQIIVTQVNLDIGNYHFYRLPLPLGVWQAGDKVGIEWRRTASWHRSLNSCPF